MENILKKDVFLVGYRGLGLGLRDKQLGLVLCQYLETQKHVE